MASNRSDNINETITHLAMPERQIPVLIDSTPDKAEGFIPSITGKYGYVTRVKRLLPTLVQGLANPQRRREIEKEHGAIGDAEWTQLRELFTLIDRLNAGDWSPKIVSDAEEILKDLPALLDRLSPCGWVKTEDKPGELAFRSASRDSSLAASFELNFGKPTWGGSGHTTVSRPDIRLTKFTDGEIRWNSEIHGTYKTAAFALSEAFTRGLSKTRFVVWWSDVGRKLVPGLYCPDVVTALYALAMWSVGTAGGWAICQKCGKDYPRSRAKQLYCSHRCQVAAAMKRYRKNLELAAKSKSKIVTKSKSRRGRK